MKGIMIQGTASDVGKSLVVTALCRMFANEDIKVAPFKSQNMSNNSYVTVDGKEIGRAQGIQAEAAMTEASVWMNPILLKPRSQMSSEVVYLGKAAESLSGREYRDHFYEKGLDVIKESLSRLEKEYSLIVIEGAGSPVEINLKDRELVNMKVADMADVPVILVSDIDRGGVFASIIGTLELLEPEERKRVAGLIINKFRGDLSLFEDGISWLEEKTGIPVVGVLPFVENHMIDGEDSLSIGAQFKGRKSANLDIAVIQPPFISNYSDLEPFLYEKDVSLRWVKETTEFGRPDAVIIPGTKSTINDLHFLRAMKFDSLIQNHVAAGGYLVGICGGFQMLGEELIDDSGSDTGIPNSCVKGLGMIPAKTFFKLEKETVRKVAYLHQDTGLPESQRLEGYEIHLGRTILERSGCSFLQTAEGRADGYYGENGKVIGTYLHHLFHNDEWRKQWLNMIRRWKGLPCRETVSIKDYKDQRFDELARKMKEHLNWNLLCSIIEGWSTRA
jgi:adenosylcobyric acid synthase